MKCFILFTCCCWSAVYCILGGTVIHIEDAPYHLSYGDVCGAALLSQRWAITAAHCGFHHYVRAGSSSHTLGFQVIVLNHIVCPRFQEKHEFDFDIQLLRLQRTVTFWKNVMAIDLGDCHGDGDDTLLVTGWGYPEEKGNYSSELKQVQVKKVSLKACQTVQQPWYNHTLTARMFCASGEPGNDACQGDSGGGAVGMSGLVGLSSFGYGCGRVPGVYTDLCNHDIRYWIYNAFKQF